MAHRDNTGVGPGANDNASGTAALVELARAYAQAETRASERVRPATRSSSSRPTAEPSARSARCASPSSSRKPDRRGGQPRAIARAGPPRIEIAGDTPRSPAATLVETAARAGRSSRPAPAARAGFGGQLLDLAFPFTLYEQGPFVARGIPALTLTTAGERPPDAFARQAILADGGASGRDRPGGAGPRRLARPGLELAQGTTSFVWFGRPRSSAAGPISCS